jgi:hypothetical protein
MLERWNVVGRVSMTTGVRTVMPMSMKRGGRVAAAMVVVAIVAAGCGDVARQGRAPVQAVVVNLMAASGADPSKFGGTLSADVLTIRTKPEPCTATNPCPTIYGDVGQVQMRLLLRNPGVSGALATPSDLNIVTFDRYRVVYRRTDGRNTPGVDVPYSFDSAATFTVVATGNTTASFEIVRNIAKAETPLRALVTNGNIISTLAEVTFYGRDQAGNEVTATGTIGISFGNFGDPG